MSKKKVTRRGATGNGADLLAAFDDLRRAIEVHARAVPKVLQKAMAAVVEELDALKASNSGEADEPLSLGAARQAGLTPKRTQAGERHDRGRVPAGHEFSGGGLRPVTERIPETERDRAVARELASFLDDLLYWAPGTLGRRRQALESAFELLIGYPFGEAWRAALEVELEWDALAKAAVGVRRARSKESTGSIFIEPVTDQEFLARMRKRVPEGTPFPRELDVAAVGKLRERVALNKGGTKKTPKAVVQEFAESLRK